MNTTPRVATRLARRPSMALHQPIRSLSMLSRLPALAHPARCTTTSPSLSTPRWTKAASTPIPGQVCHYGARSFASAGSPSVPLEKTPLYDLHVAHGAKMVPFGGFHMPVQYSSLSVSASHVFTREKASLFDVSHMVQRRFHGPGAAGFLETVTPAFLTGLETHRSTLSTLLHRGTGGIVDDTVVTRLAGDLFYVVTNAACRDKDDAYLADELGMWEAAGGRKVHHDKMDGWGLVALQGPLSAEVLAECLAEPAEVDLPNLLFGSSRYGRVRLHGGSDISSPLLISRGGYTGEDGFEISIPADETTAVAESLLGTAGPQRLQLAGLGARDSLRLEAGMCLYGHDLDDSTTPVEAGLGWVVAKERRASGGFHGAEVILPSLTPRSKGGAGVSRRRVGLVVEGAPAREGAEIVVSSTAVAGAGDEGRDKIGTVTSGCPSPTLGKNIAMGYVKDGYHKAGTEVAVVVRGKARRAVVTKMPFVPTKYWKGTAPA